MCVSTFHPVLAGLFGMGGPEMVLIFAIILLLFGGKRLPELASGLGKSIREFKRASQQIEDEVERSLDASAAQPRPRIATVPASPVSHVETASVAPVAVEAAQSEPTRRA